MKQQKKPKPEYTKVNKPSIPLPSSQEIPLLLELSKEKEFDLWETKKNQINRNGLG